MGVCPVDGPPAPSTGQIRPPNGVSAPSAWQVVGRPTGPRPPPDLSTRQVNSVVPRLTLLCDGSVFPELEALLAAQAGVFARHQALGCGFTSRSFAAAVGAGGPFVRVHHGVYTTRKVYASLDAAGRQLLVIRAAGLVCEADTFVFSHSSACALQGLPMYGVDDDLVHLTRFSVRRATRTQAGIRHHFARLDRRWIDDSGELATTHAARTALDMTVSYGYRAGLVAADAALLGGMAWTELAELAETITCEPRGPVMSAVARDARLGAQSPLETLSRIEVGAIGIDDLVLQHEIRLSDGTSALVDLYSPKLDHVFESDGSLKYRDGQTDLWGQRMTVEQIVFSEKRREDLIRSQGTGFSRIVWSDVQPAGRARLHLRLRETKCIGSPGDD